MLKYFIMTKARENNMKDRKRVLVLFCGGTIVMEEKRDGSLAVPDSRD
jgi:L-asparaginase/Glu-tRNA(Gln) amidotransferase subunit D